VPAALKAINFKDIARQLVENAPGNKLNVIFGGGRDHLGAGDGAYSVCPRIDGVNLVEEYLQQFDNETVAKFVKNTRELRDIDYENVDHVMGLFANNHMSYESLRRKDLDGQPSLSEMTETAIKILNNEQGFVLIVEGGLIDVAHHQNQARFALEELIELEKAIKVAKDMTSSEDTLIIVTADHAQSMAFNGHPDRGNDILAFGSKGPDHPFYDLGFGLKSEAVSYFETLSYSNGPGFNYHLAEGSTSTFVPIESFTEEQRKDPSYRNRAMVGMNYATHGGEDVGVFSGEVTIFCRFFSS
jgi:alkaline phosphatase